MKFKDQYGRMIDLQFNDEGDLEAWHHDEVIGLFEFYQDHDIPDSPCELVHMDILKAYQQAGIGTAMIRCAVMELEYFILPLPEWFVDAPNRLTEEGAALINHCFRNKILPEKFEEQYNQH